ncbi:MAG TPA: hypothetical protein VGS22_28655 [Thermoanaerobaculia bacterium]|nr:hypothetical protein [Thermoanaerobaculia bacterium]
MTTEQPVAGETPERRLLARDASLVERIRVYRRGEALEVDTSSFYRITRHRVLFEEVELATIHQGRSYRTVLLLGLFGLFIGAIAGAGVSNSSGGMIALWIVAPTVAFALVGFVIPDWVVSIQSRRTWTRMRFGAVHGKARRVFDELVAAIRETQSRLAAERPTASAIRSPFAPPPAEVPAPSAAALDEPAEPILPLPGDPVV